jgi:hypothetical protein
MRHDFKWNGAPAVAIWCISAVAVLAQEPTPVSTPVPTPLQFQEVVQVAGATRDQLYDAALAWFPSAFKSGKDVLQIPPSAQGSPRPRPRSPGEPLWSASGASSGDGRSRRGAQGKRCQLRCPFGATFRPKVPTGA